MKVDFASSSVVTEFSFYHLLHTPLEQALAKLLEKVLESGSRALVLVSSEERAEVLCSVLWSYDTASFLPHGTARDGCPEKQPVWITSDDENRNMAEILIIADGATANDPIQYNRCLDLFDGRDEAAVSAARRRWSAFKAHGHALTYWQQTKRGGWERQA